MRTIDDPVAAAGRLQAEGSDPRHSAFVSASAGSGKTKLLIDRLLRLMLPGPGRPAAAPERILCLTFTKAAAAEMAIRLRARLGEWVVLPDDALDAALGALSIVPSDAIRRDARALFARVLDMPGGLRIGTVHAWCEKLLRRFPLEARLSPHFRLLEEADGADALDRLREEVAASVDPAAVDALASRIDAVQHAGLIGALSNAIDRLAHARTLAPAALAAALRAVLRVADADEAALLARAARGTDDAALRDAIAVVAAHGSDAARDVVRPIADWLARDPATRAETWDAWRGLMLTADGKRRSLLRAGRFTAAHPAVVEAFDREAARVQLIEADRAAIGCAEATVALLTLSNPAIERFADGKAALGLLDFDDLIRRTGALLDDPGVAWVLFKLDGGLDHLLLDEVQDTSGAQWRIAGRLTEEFFAGAGAAAGSGAGEGARTVFAVGDFKQSIYSFQGADPDAFHHWRGVFRARAAAVGHGFREPLLDVSFRSAAPVLAFVDRVFAGPDAARGVAEAGATVPAHRSSDPGVPGRVEVWPLARPEEGPDAPAGGGGGDADDPWTPPRANRLLLTGEQRLAAALADRLAREIAAGTVRPGEVLILVRRRTNFLPALVRALKNRDVPVAGLDRVVLTEQQAVADLLALLDAILLPEDDLAVATVLVSPLGFCDDASLMALSLDRGDATLSETLRRRAAERPDWTRADAFLERMRARADWVSPYALLVEALGVEGGRARFYARLGRDCGEAIDEMLASALGFAATRVPSLQGFVQWLRRSAAEVKRETPELADEVRLMTVHGAKGLEGRLVVLADTVRPPDERSQLFWTEEAPVLPVWVAGAALRSPATDALREAGRARALAEYNRLLYVGLTRAREGLIVCGALGRGATASAGPDSWYAHCRRAIEDAPGVVPVDPLPGGPEAWDGAGWRLGGALRPASLPKQTGDSGRAAGVGAAPVPRWLGADRGWRASPPPPAEEIGRRSLVPSRPENVSLGPVPPSRSPRARRGRASFRARGDAIHRLLQRLPAVPPDQRRDGGRRLLRGLPAGDDDADADALVDEALAVIDAPALAPLFGPDGRAEQRIAGRVGDLAVDGIVDRMAIGADAILLADFKSGRLPPVLVERTPVLYLRQMAAYRAVLQALLPGRPVRTALVWTSDATVVHLPDTLLDRHAPGTIAGA